MKQLLVLVIGAFAAAAWARLPPPSEEAKAKAEEAKAKAAWNDKVAAFQLCKAQDKVAAQYLKTKAKDAKPAPTPACADPGPYAPPASASAAPAASAPKK